MATLPNDAKILTFEEALAFHFSWTEEDRAFVRDLLVNRYGEQLSSLAHERGTSIEWYSPPSGAYVAGHRGKSTLRLDQTRQILAEITDSSPSDFLYVEPKVNCIYIHAGFLKLDTDTEDPEIVDLPLHCDIEGQLGSRKELDPPVCEQCFLVRAGECP